jgi:hypothetical protein
MDAAKWSPWGCGQAEPPPPIIGPFLSTDAHARLRRMREADRILFLKLLGTIGLLGAVVVVAFLFLSIRP